MRKAVAIGFIVVLLPCGVIFQLLWSVNSFLLNPNFYGNIVRESGIVNTLYAASNIGQTFADAQALTNGTPLGELVNSFAPSTEELNRQIGTVVEDVYRVLDGQQDYISYQLNLSGAGNLIAGDMGVLLLREYGAGLSECEPDQAPYRPPGFTATTLEPLPLPMCRPSNVTAHQFGEQLAASQNEILSSWPQYVTYIVPVVRNAQERATLQGFGNFRDGLRSTMLTFGALSAVLLGLAAFIGGKTLRGRLRWSGIAVLPPAIAILLFGSALSGLVASALVPVSVTGSVEDMIGLSLVGALASGVAQAINTFWLTGLFFTIIGAALFILGSRLERFRLQKAAAVVTNAAGAAGTMVNDGLRRTIQDERVQSSLRRGSEVLKQGNQTVQQTLQDERVQNTMGKSVEMLDRGKQSLQRTIQDERVQSSLKDGINFLKRGAVEAQTRLDKLAQSVSTDAAPVTTTVPEAEEQRAVSSDMPIMGSDPSSIDDNNTTDLPPSPSTDPPPTSTT